jgi:hypothetical protein
LQWIEDEIIETTKLFLVALKLQSKRG